jgi:hypothetical protein
MAIIAGEYGRVLAPHDGDSKGMCVRIATDGARHQLQKENQTPLWTAEGRHSVRVHLGMAGKWGYKHEPSIR